MIQPKYKTLRDFGLTEENSYLLMVSGESIKKKDISESIS